MCSRTAPIPTCKAAMLLSKPLLLESGLTSALLPAPAALRFVLLGSLLLAPHSRRRFEFRLMCLLSLDSSSGSEVLELFKLLGLLVEALRAILCLWSPLWRAQRRLPGLPSMLLYSRSLCHLWSQLRQARCPSYGLRSALLPSRPPFGFWPLFGCGGGHGAPPWLGVVLSAFTGARCAPKLPYLRLARGSCSGGRATPLTVLSP